MFRCCEQAGRSPSSQEQFQRTMTVPIPLIVAAALGLAFVAYKYPTAYRVMFVFGVPVLVIVGFLVLAIKVGDANNSINAIYNQVQNIRNGAVSNQLSYQIVRLYSVKQFLKVFLIYYMSGFGYLLFLFFLP